MPFVKQDNTNSCGAICLCYLKWLIQGRDPNETLTSEQIEADYDEIKDVYAAVQFGDGQPKPYSKYQVPEDYCDPVRMILLLQLMHKNVSFYIDEHSGMFPVFQALSFPQSRDSAFIHALYEAGGLNFRNPPCLGPNQAAIAIYNVEDSGGDVRGQHYILFREHEKVLYRYNPWDGTQVQCEGYTRFQCGPYWLSPADAAIVIV